MKSRILLASVALVLSLCAAEIGLRIRQGTLFAEPKPYLRPDPVLGWGYVPGLDLRWDTDEFKATDHFNALGLPDIERSIEPPAGVPRVVALGDSITSGNQVDRALRYTTLIESALSDRLGRAEVVNTGVISYQTDQEVLYYEDFGRQLRPRLVLLFLFVGNDIGGNAKSEGSMPGVIAKPRFRLESGELVLERVPTLPDGTLPSNPWGYPGRRSMDPLSAVKDTLYRVSALYRAAADAWFRLRRRFDTETVPLEWRVFEAGTPDPEVREAWDITEALLGRLRDDVRGDGAQLGVVIIPDQLQIDPARWGEFLRQYRLDATEWDPSAPHLRLKSICERTGIPCLDLLPIMRGGPGLYFPKDGHLTPAGHRAVASAVVPWLVTSGLIRSLE